MALFGEHHTVKVRVGGGYNFVYDPNAYPARWIGKVTVETTDGRRFDGRVDEPKGDPGNTLSPVELEDKAVRLARYRDGASEAEMRRVIADIRALASTARVPRFLS